MTHRITPRRREHGIALVTSLIFLVVLTLIGVTAMQGTTLEERMAGNLVAQNQAFQRAEGTLKEAQDWLSQTVNMSNFSANGTNGLYAYVPPGQPRPDYTADATWSPGATRTAQNHPNSRYYVEQETANPVVKPGESCAASSASCPKVLVFRVTVRATDDSGNAVAMLRQRFWKQVN